MDHQHANKQANANANKLENANTFTNTNDSDCDDDSDTCGDEFVGYNEWATEKLGVVLYTDFVYDYDGDGNRGVFVAEDIAPQTRVVSVPFGSLLTLQWLRDQVHKCNHPVYKCIPLFRSILSHEDGAWDAEREDDALGIALLYERFIARDKSPWHPHLELLPKSYENVLYCEDADLIRGFQGSNVVHLTHQMKRKVQADYEQFQLSTLPQIIDTVTEVHPDLQRKDIDKAFSIEQYQWALSTIWSRFVSVERPTSSGSSSGSSSGFSSGAVALKAMAPVFDMLNHNPQACGVSHGYNSKTNALEVVTHDHVAAGTQLCINYGALSNHHLVTLYGFVVPGNPFDTVEMWMPMEQGTSLLYDQKVHALLEMGIDHETTSYELCIDNEQEEDKEDEEEKEEQEHREEELLSASNALLLIAARVIALDGHEKVPFDKCVDTIKYGGIVSVDHEVRALSLLIYKLEQLLAQYENGNEKDNATTTSALTTKQQQHYAWMAKVVCASDRAILSHNIDSLKTKLLRVLPGNSTIGTA